MAKLIYTGITSLDGYVADSAGNFDWSAPDQEVHSYVNKHEGDVGTYLYGRRIYEVMLFWETAHTEPDLPDVEREFADIWRAADKIVYSTTLTVPSSARTRLESAFDPVAVRQLKESADRDLAIGGADLAAQAVRAGLVDEYHVYVTPHIVGGGTPYLPRDVRVDLELMDAHRFGGGTVHLRYRAAGSA